jgi:hypothetical protein
MARRRSSRPELPSITRAVAEAVAPRPPDPVGAECRRLLALLRKQCPGLVPAAPLPAGQPGAEIPLDPKTGEALYRLVARQISGLPTEAIGEAGVVVWTQGDDELTVFVDEVAVTTAEGAIAIDIPVRCDQAGTATVRVRLATGNDARPAGFVAATDERPLGPGAVVDVWGEALTAFAWHILLTTTAKLADASGRDADGAGLIPVGVRANEGGLVVVTMARHTFDRKVIG